MTSPNTVQVANIAAKTEDKEIKDFFSFCGKITDIKVTSEGASKSAVVTFEKETAAKTALLLNHTKLGENEITVTGSTDADKSDSGYKHQDDRDTDDITQEEKPRSRILAEYLAHGYVVADASLKKAIDLDEQHGVSSRFLNTLTSLDNKYHATDRAKTVDQSYGITQRASGLLSGLGSYFEKATNTPTGRKLVQFYTNGQRQVEDIHNEARRLAELKKQEHGGSAYKAAGLDKVFGAEKEKPKATDAPGSAPANAPAVESTQTATAPSNVPAQNTATQIPKFDAPPTGQ
ncbi:hypothetical protein CONLIGDRAFT_717841 [Coniochaeta ligniaria NRRL 30616]|uniref:RRM domain-containing protein n=1 Tax=Coniochaeta ligniaria NRRL 30616 TaxID=1408157 RepID=A0A1J7J4T7_9PEZI|nr:hypothetical protein CONLIGDRAFT_717841 [Coniochaeta ligniaria NRRL 30616]